MVKLVTYVVDVNKSSVIRSALNKVPQVGLSKRAVSRSVRAIMGQIGSGGGGNAWYKSVPGWAASGAGLVSLSVGLAFSSYLNQSGITIFRCIDPTKNCPAAEKTDPANQVAIQNAMADYENEIGSKSVISGVGLGLGVALLGVGGYFFYRQSQSVAALPFGPTEEDPYSVMPPKEFGHARAVFAIGQGR